MVHGLFGSLFAILIYILSNAPVIIRYYVLSLLILIHFIYLLNAKQKSKHKSNPYKKQSHIFPSQFCMCPNIQLRNEFLFQDPSYACVKHWSINDVACVHSLALTKHLIKRLLWYFLFTSKCTLFLSRTVSHDTLAVY